MNPWLWDRRSFLKKTALLSGFIIDSTNPFAAPAYCKDKAPSEKLNIACIGIQNRGGENLQGVKDENIIALCDIDDRYMESVGANFPNAKRYFDYRQMFDEIGDKLDAVTVSTTDHTHALISLAAMNRGIHCYCEKPLAHTISEVRKMVAVANEKKLVTQMGIQIHASSNYRRVVELIRAGAIGEIIDVHCWTPGGGIMGPTPTNQEECPTWLHWDQWLGPAPEQSYHSCFHPGRWRYWWDFGSGRFGDMACHLTDIVFWALNIRHPYSIESHGSENTPVDQTPPTMTVEYKFHRPTGSVIIPERLLPSETAVHRKPAMADPLTLYWTVGPAPKIVEETAKQLPPESQQKPSTFTQGILFRGRDGSLLLDYGRNELYPVAKYVEYRRPAPSIDNGIGHHTEWLAAIRAGKPDDSLCNFRYGAELTETAMLGNISWRSGQKKIQWDAATGRIVNLPEANAFLTKKYRKGWELE